MKKKFHGWPTIIMTIAVIVIAGGVLILGGIVSIDSWEPAKEFLAPMEPNAGIISGAVAAFSGCLFLIIGIKMDK